MKKLFVTFIVSAMIFGVIFGLWKLLLSLGRFGGGVIVWVIIFVAIFYGAWNTKAGKK